MSIRPSDHGATCTWAIRSTATGQYCATPELGTQTTADIGSAYLWMSESSARKFADVVCNTGHKVTVVRARP